MQKASLRCNSVANLQVEHVIEARHVLGTDAEPTCLFMKAKETYIKNILKHKQLQRYRQNPGI